MPGLKTFVNIIQSEPLRTVDLSDIEVENRLVYTPKQGSIQTNQFVNRFAQEPLKIYSELAAQAQATRDGNFSFPELKETFDNIERHINDLLNSLLDENSPSRVYVEFEPLSQQLLGEIAEISTKKYPYKDSIWFISKFVEMVDYVVFRRETQPEIESYGLNVDSAGTGLIYSAVKQKRNEKDGKNYGLGFPIYKSTVTLHDIYSGNPPSAWKGSRVKDLLKHPDLILLPSYNPLDAAFFTKIRQVPMCMLGLLNIPYLNADGQRLSPFNFYDHDAFHADQLYSTIEAKVGDIKDSSPLKKRIMKYELWDRNSGKLRSKIDTVGNIDLKVAINIVLFTVLHEPMSFVPEEISLPAVVEKDAISARLKDDTFISTLAKRYVAGEFGFILLKVLENFYNAKSWILTNMDDFEGLSP